MRRQPQPEWMDSPAADARELASSLLFIEGVNRWFGYTRATVRRVKELAAPHDTVLDVATGAADVPAALLRAGACRRLVALDFHPATLSLAQSRVGAVADIRLVRGDAFKLPFADCAADGVITSMFLHHLDEAGVVRVLQEMRRVSSGWLLLADLVRTRRALFWIWLFTRLSNPMVRHDALASVRQAWTCDEMLAMAKQAGWQNAAVHRHFGHRMVVTARV